MIYLNNIQDILTKANITRCLFCTGLIFTENMISAQQTYTGSDYDDHILLYEHSDHHADPDTEKHQSQKSSHFLIPLFLPLVISYEADTTSYTYLLPKEEAGLP